MLFPLRLAMPSEPKISNHEADIFTMSKMFFANPLKIFTICAEKVCYKLANMRYKLANARYKVCNMRYKVCNKNSLIWKEK